MSSPGSCRSSSPVEHVGPLAQDPATARRVVGDGGGQAEAAHEVEGRLHQLAHARPRLVDARARSTVSRCVSRPTRCSSGPTAASSASSVRAATHSSSAAAKTGEAKWSPSISDHRAESRAPPAAEAPARTALGELGAAALGEVLDGRHDEVVLGREVVQLRAAAHARALGDEGGRGAGEAALDQQLDRRLQQPGPHRAGPVGLRHAGLARRRVVTRPACRRTNKQSSLTFCARPRVSRDDLVADPPNRLPERP